MFMGVSIFFFLMIRRPPGSTRTYTLFPYTTLFRSARPIGATASCRDSRPFGISPGAPPRHAGGRSVDWLGALPVGLASFRDDGPSYWLVRRAPDCGACGKGVDGADHHGPSRVRGSGSGDERQEKCRGRTE